MEAGMLKSTAAYSCVYWNGSAVDSSLKTSVKSHKAVDTVCRNDTIHCRYLQIRVDWGWGGDSSPMQRLTGSKEIKCGRFPYPHRVFAVAATFPLLTVAPCLGCTVQLATVGTCPPSSVQVCRNILYKCEISPVTEASCATNMPSKTTRPLPSGKMTPSPVLRHSQEALRSCTDDCRPAIRYFF